MAILVLLAAGITWWTLARGSAPTDSAAPADTAASASPTPFTYGASQAACQELTALVKAGRLDNLELIGSYADQASDSADAGVAQSARLLRQMVEIAVAAKGQSDETATAEKTRAYAVDLQKACAKAGYA